MPFPDRAPVEVSGTAVAMASSISIRALASADRATPERAVDHALKVFEEVEKSCTRFVPTSPLMLANAAPDSWRRVPPPCFRAISEAYRAYLLTQGRFDPRIMGDLTRLGYDHSLPFGSGPVQTGVRSPLARRPMGEWRPRFRRVRRTVLLGGRPVDLGGIGKGLAVRWASQRLRAVAPDHLVEAGGDCYCAGRAPAGDLWKVGVEDPFGDSEPVAVLELSDRACATSSIRLRHWEAGGTLVHHLIDPRTGLPGGSGLRAVTVIDKDPAIAEVWSKSLFLEGSEGVQRFSDERGLAALWIDDGGGLAISRAMAPFLVWRRA